MAMPICSNSSLMPAGTADQKKNTTECHFGKSTSNSKKHKRGVPDRNRSESSSSSPSSSQPSSQWNVTPPLGTYLMCKLLVLGIFIGRLGAHLNLSDLTQMTCAFFPFPLAYPMIHVKQKNKFLS